MSDDIGDKIGDGVKAIPEDLSKLVKGDIKLGKLKIPKIAVAGVAVGVVVFVALKSRSKSGSVSTGFLSTNKADEYSSSNQEQPLPSASPLVGNPLGSIVNPASPSQVTLPSIPTPSVPELSGLPNLEPIDLSNSNIPILSTAYNPNTDFGDATNYAGNTGFVTPKDSKYELPKGNSVFKGTKGKGETVPNTTPKQYTDALAKKNAEKAVQATVKPLQTVFNSFSNLYKTINPYAAPSPQVPVKTIAPIPTSRQSIVVQNNTKPISYPSFYPTVNSPYISSRGGFGSVIPTQIKAAVPNVKGRLTRTAN